MYGQDLNTIGGRLTAMAMAAAEDYGFTYQGRVAGIHTFIIITSQGEISLQCTDNDIRDSSLPVMLQQRLTR